VPADFFTPGPIEVWAKFRAGVGTSQWYYLGTAVTFPDVQAHYQHVPFAADYNAPGVFQLIAVNEYHVVTFTTNRPNYGTVNRLRSDNSGTANLVRRFRPGRLVLNAYDCQLFFRYRYPNALAGEVEFPEGSQKGRLYYSAVLRDCAEADPTRVRDVTLLFECHPLWEKATREFKLYTENETEFPTVTPE
jgi:hypothetical protein